MVKKTLPVVNWNKRASQALKREYERIIEESYDNAELVKNGIREIVDSLPNHPEKFPRDKFKTNNEGNYRAFEAFSYRVAYKHTEKEIRILRIRHVKQEPKKY